MRDLLLLLGLACCTSVVRAFARFTPHRGYIAQDADIVNGTMTIDKAQQVCSENVECMGITFAGDWDQLWALGTARYRAQVWLKGTEEWIQAPGHVSFTKELATCENMRFLRYKRKGFGPFCCEGRSCPTRSEYSSRESECQLPASVPLGLPACSNLRGNPLRNLALDGRASASSEYAPQPPPMSLPPLMPRVPVWHVANGAGWTHPRC